MKSANTPTTSILSPKQTSVIGCWNVRTLYEAGKLSQVIREMDKCGISILGISECRWTGSGKMVHNTGAVICWSGRSDGLHQGGVAVIMSKEASKSLVEWRVINERIISVRLKSNYGYLTVIQCYSPINDDKVEEKEEFYEAVNGITSTIPKHDVLIIMGDMNAKVGEDNIGMEYVMGKHGKGIRNDNGERLVDFCMHNSMVIGGTIFKHKEHHTLTWTSPNGRVRNQIDHIMINRKWRTSLQDVRVKRGPDVNSDHYLVIGKIKLKLRKNKVKSDRKVFDIKKLRKEEVKGNFCVELQNRFQALGDLGESIEEQWENIRNAYTDTSQTVLGYRNNKRKEWLSDRTWQLIEERKKVKHQIHACSEDVLKEQKRREYTATDKQVKSSAKQDKKNYIEEQAERAEIASSRGDIRMLHNITKQLCGKMSPSHSHVKDKDGRILQTEEQQAERWKEHFSNVLNRDDPEITADIGDIHQELDIDITDITREEIRSAIRKLKKNKAAGTDNIYAEMMKESEDISTETLFILFNKIWTEERVPEQWKEGTIIKLPKKGDLTQCNNWRGITLLSVPGKVMCRIMLERMKGEVDTILRKEQSGFRRNRSCVDNIFCLRNIIEQSLEWRSPLYINFIDFEKAFDSIHRVTLWKIMESYGIPKKIIGIIKGMYDGFRCRVKHERTTSDWFLITSGVRQGCIISPFMFLLCIDWMMKKVTEEPLGIHWTFTSGLEDIDFADDISLLSHTQQQMQEKTHKLKEVGEKLGLKINRRKTKVMRMNNRNNNQISIDENNLEEVETFCYLGSVVNINGEVKEEVNIRIGKAATAFRKLGNIWKSRRISRKTKIKLYNSNVRSVLLYAAETWKTNKEIESRLRGFEGRCLRRILGVRWQDRVSNKEVTERTGIGDINLEIKRRRWRYLGHVLRMEEESIARRSVKWAPPGKRKPGRPRGTWRRTVQAEMKETGYTWNTIGRVAQERSQWRDLVTALCVDIHEED